ncbi:MAG: O-antigen polysaccharide polymerase Wzy [Clostridia bacterium]|nr:O-antigen polysaccharide polymerase Wzy [Clostridia bacterium]
MITREKLFVFILDIIFGVAICFLPDTILGSACIYMADFMVISIVVMQIIKGFPDLMLFLFNITYFLFMLSGGTATMLMGGVIEDYLVQNTKVTNEACLMALLGIAVINTTYVFFEGLNVTVVIRESPLENKTTAEPTGLQRLGVAVIFFVTAFCKLLMAIETFFYSQDNGYIALYTKQTSILPSFIGYIGALFYFALMLFFACNFSKKATFSAFAVVGIIELLILIAGDRGEAVCAVFVLIVYTIFRVKKEPTFLRSWKIVLIIIIFLLPTGVYFLQVIKYTRIGEELTLGYWDTILDFFISQGVSLEILGYSVTLKERIAEMAGNNFVFGHLKEYLTQNVVSRTLFGFEYIIGNTTEAAMTGTSYGSTMSYLRFKDSYLSGMGCGSVFLSELYHDYSWAGIIIGSFFLGMLLLKLKNMNVKGWIQYAVSLNCVRAVLTTPRTGYFKWLTETFAFPNLLLLLLIVFIGIVSKKQVVRYKEGL